ncbi:hypothetical protein K2173_015909 [Erythroxylum novogranatense]|uniref:Uncharacterized protein n=1 Tax=Erythroxylum novogranatense TaxID=1862640 RepID=A0AAV8SFA3_9ROSI|nr:hypothetical protein K2173_015909 [Erythroxylum novogranatense]
MADNIAKLADPDKRGVSFLDHCPVVLQALLDADRNGKARLRLPQHRLTSCFRSLPGVSFLRDFKFVSRMYVYLVRSLDHF